MSTFYYVPQYFTTQLSVAGGIDDTQTTGIVLQSISGVDETLPGIIAVTWSNPIDTTKVEYITYTSINATTKELQGVTRGEEGYSAKPHVNGATVAWPLSKSHINNIPDSTTTFSNKTYLLTAEPSPDHTVLGTTIALTANENQAFGDVCFINADGQAQLGDADAIATSSCIAMCADNTINADASGNYLLMGIARNDVWNWTVGGLIYLTVTGTSGNTITQTAPTGSDDVVQVLGIATNADRMYFNPMLTQTELV